MHFHQPLVLSGNRWFTDAYLQFTFVSVNPIASMFIFVINCRKIFDFAFVKSIGIPPRLSKPIRSVSEGWLTKL